MIRPVGKNNKFKENHNLPYNRRLDLDQTLPFWQILQKGIKIVIPVPNIIPVAFRIVLILYICETGLESRTMAAINIFIADNE